MDAELCFPGRIKKTSADSRRFPATTINDNAVQVVESTFASGSR